MIARHASSRLVAAMILSAAPAAVRAQVPTLSLSDAQKAELLDRDTESSVATARSGLTGGDVADRRIHGVVGAEIGSRGTRSIFGAAAIPLGENAGATISYEQSRYGYPR